MTSNRKKYFTFFGILLSTVNRKMHSCFSSIASFVAICMPKISNILRLNVLKPIKTYSTNNLK